MRLPIFDSRDGRTVIGYATGERSAGLAIRRLVTIPPGFALYVWRRSRFAMDLNELADGYVYSIGSRVTP
jgi:hypothetical protein